MKRKALAIVLILAMLLSMGNCSINNLEALAKEITGNNVFTAMNTADALGNPGGFLLSDGVNAAKVYVDTAREEFSESDGKGYCGLEIIARTFAGDVELVTGKAADVVTSAADMSGNVIIAGTIGKNEVIDTLISKGAIDVSGLYKDGALKWDCYQMQFVGGDVLSACGYNGVSSALVITGSNKRGAMYGLFNISEHIGVS
ncbi:MAG: hypothetical protein K2K09_02825, partial [Lachnospiraceae bacterium]|nr:hypothetical protein [Lachnospiraceae bacterium]